MNNNNGHDELGGDSGSGRQDGSSTSIKQRFIQHPTGQQKATRPTTSTVVNTPPQTSTLSPIRSFEGRRYRDILRQESLSVSKENLNGVVTSGKWEEELKLTVSKSFIGSRLEPHYPSQQEDGLKESSLDPRANYLFMLVLSRSQCADCPVRRALSLYVFRDRWRKKGERGKDQLEKGEREGKCVVGASRKESDDGSDESTPTRSKSQPVVRRNKEYRYPTHRWSQFKISFDNDSVRLESEMHPLQSTGGAGGSGGGERAAGSLSTGPSGALMTTSSSISAAGGTMAPSAASTVPPTIKIIGKEGSVFLVAPRVLYLRLGVSEWLQAFVSLNIRKIERRFEELQLDALVELLSPFPGHCRRDDKRMSDF
ncbi:hypothetical protein DAPPUDRAFT_93967 [Daphnia pulex]|uniref:Uncharacterized protein n=1 Tax=Daphnia pulex TaxID=6669 RepID=E9FRS3_DAPPU|nr:hypothetical protein DAPPUDRAFT_93967 [Daphnia pulex]|eukprot:EFX90432.1 hypothetical protein DAPPUDRAFT_93967 [Daphnia pulex]